MTLPLASCLQIISYFTRADFVAAAAVFAAAVDFVAAADPALKAADFAAGGRGGPGPFIQSLRPELPLHAGLVLVLVMFERIP